MSSAPPTNLGISGLVQRVDTLDAQSGYGVTTAWAQRSGRRSPNVHYIPVATSLARIAGVGEAK